MLFSWLFLCLAALSAGAGLVVLPLVTLTTLVSVNTERRRAKIAVGTLVGVFAVGAIGAAAGRVRHAPRPGGGRATAALWHVVVACGVLGIAAIIGSITLSNQKKQESDDDQRARIQRGMQALVGCSVVMLVATAGLGSWAWQRGHRVRAAA